MVIKDLEESALLGGGEDGFGASIAIGVGEVLRRWIEGAGGVGGVFFL